MYPLWIEKSMLGVAYGASWSASSDKLVHSGTNSSKPVIANPTTVGNGTTTAGVTFPVNVYGANASPTGYPVMGRDGSKEFLWAPAGSTLLIAMTFDSSTPVFSTNPGASVAIEMWARPGETYQTSYALTWVSATSKMVSAQLPLTSGAWVRPSNIVVNGGPFGATTFEVASLVVVIGGTITVNYVEPSITVVPVTATCLFPSHGPPELSTSVIPYTSTRVTAVAALFTNVTKVMNKEGTVLAGRIDPAQTNDMFMNFTDSLLSSLHPAEKQYLGMETGFYTYCPPSTDLVDFVDYVGPSVLYSGQGVTGTINVPQYNLGSKSMVNAFYFADSDGSSNMAVNCDLHMEFRTSSALWQIGLSSLTIEAFHQAQLSLVSVGFFFPNETHLTLRNKVIPWLSRALELVSPYAAKYHPMAGMALRGGSILLRSNPGKTPATTSAKGSGIIPKKEKHVKKKKAKFQRPPSRPPSRGRSTSRSRK